MSQWRLFQFVQTASRWYSLFVLVDGRESSFSKVDKSDCSSSSLWVIFSYLNGHALLFSLKSNTLCRMEYFGWHFLGTDRSSSYRGHHPCLLYNSPSKQTIWWFYLFFLNQRCIVHSLMLIFYYNLQFFLSYCCLTSYFSRQNFYFLVQNVLLSLVSAHIHLTDFFGLEALILFPEWLKSVMFCCDL